MSAEKKPSGREIIDRYLETQEVDSELAFIRMVTYIPGGVTKKHRFLALSKKMEDGRDAYLMRMIGPEEFKGVTVFARYQGEGEADQYIYLPEVGRVTRLGGDSKSGAFLGSDFTFEDLLHEVPANFTYTRAADALTFGAEAYVVKAKPSGDDSGSIYVRRDLYIEKGTFNLLKVDFFGPGEKLVKSSLRLRLPLCECKGRYLSPGTGYDVQQGKGYFNRVRSHGKSTRSESRGPFIYPAAHQGMDRRGSQGSHLSEQFHGCCRA